MGYNVPLLFGKWMGGAIGWELRESGAHGAEAPIPIQDYASPLLSEKGY